MAGARAYNGGLPVESRGKAPGQGVRGKPPWSWKHFEMHTTNFRRKIWRKSDD